jgi:hypothetical protein
MTLVMHACEKLLLDYQVEEHGQESKNGRRLSRAETDNGVPAAKRL